MSDNCAELNVFDQLRSALLALEPDEDGLVHRQAFVETLRRHGLANGSIDLGEVWKCAPHRTAPHRIAFHCITVQRSDNRTQPASARDRTPPLISAAAAALHAHSRLTARKRSN